MSHTSTHLEGSGSVPPSHFSPPKKNSINASCKWLQPLARINATVLRPCKTGAYERCCASQLSMLCTIHDNVIRTYFKIIIFLKKAATVCVQTGRLCSEFVIFAPTSWYYCCTYALTSDMLCSFPVCLLQLFCQHLVSSWFNIADVWMEPWMDGTDPKAIPGTANYLH